MKLPKYFTTVTLFSKSIALILFVLLPFIAFGLGMRYEQFTQNVETMQENVSFTSSPTPTPQQEWKTYTFVRPNTSIPKFQVNYPTEWDYREVSAGDPLHLIFYTSSIGKLSREVNDTTIADDPSLPQPLKAPIEIQVLVGKVNRCPCEDVTVGGFPAKKIVLENWEIVDLVKNNYTFSVMRSLKNGQVDTSLSTEKEIEIFNTMLSTFKFIN